jgi:hypothetical protein
MSPSIALLLSVLCIIYTVSLLLYSLISDQDGWMDGHSLLLLNTSISSHRRQVLQPKLILSYQNLYEYEMNPYTTDCIISHLLTSQVDQLCWLIRRRWPPLLLLLLSWLYNYYNCSRPKTKSNWGLLNSLALIWKRIFSLKTFSTKLIQQKSPLLNPITHISKISWIPFYIKGFYDGNGDDDSVAGGCGQVLKPIECLWQG